jgi:uncharacterized membrane protein YesL
MDSLNLSWLVRKLIGGSLFGVGLAIAVSTVSLFLQMDDKKKREAAIPIVTGLIVSGVILPLGSKIFNTRN